MTGHDPHSSAARRLHTVPDRLLRHVVLLESVVARLEERLRGDPAGEG